VEKEILLSGELTETALRELIVRETFLHEGYFLGERLPQEVMDDPQKRQNLLYFEHYKRYNNQKPMTYYTSGRIFANDFELRWERDEATWRVIYLGVARNLVPLEEVPGITLGTVRTKHYYLFGQRLRQNQIQGIPGDSDFFAEARIPRLLHYPSGQAGEKKERACLKVYEYLDTRGQVQAFRFVQPEGAE
jgi:hypothetical protein